MSKKASEFQEKAMSRIYRGKEIFKPLNTGRIDERVCCVREFVANIFFYTKNGVTIMIDAGYNYGRLKEKMGWLDLDPTDIRHILITHQDTDHVGAVETDSEGLFCNATLYIGEEENRYLTCERRRKVIYGLYKLPMVYIDNPKKLLRDGQIFTIDGIKIECFLVPGHTWGHMVFLIDDEYLFTGDTIWFGADGGRSFINMLAEDNRVAIRSLEALEKKLRARGLRLKIITGHTGWTDDLDFAFANRDKVCNAYVKQKPHDPYAPYDAYDESDDTRERAGSTCLRKRTGNEGVHLAERTQNTTFRIKTDGFHGELFCPAKDEYPGKVLICFGGSDGKFELARMLASVFQGYGLTTLALAYVYEPGLPNQFYRVPIDPLEKAAKRLHEMDYKQVGLWGISKGAELALTAGSLLPGLVNAVVAVSPMSTVCQGFAKERGIKLMPGSSWSFHGKDLPYTPFGFEKFPYGSILGKSLKAGEITMFDLYLPMVQHPNPEAEIKAENITGPILLLSSKMDTMWSSEPAAKRIVERLEANRFAYPYQHLNYDYGSHLFVPMELSAAKFFRGDRGKNREPGRNARMDSLVRTLDFITQW